MKITAIKRQVKNAERVSVFIDGKYELSLSLDELLQQGIKNSQDLDDADVKRLKKVSSDGKLRAKTLEWLLNRPHSTRELKDYLFRKKAEPELTKVLISEFTDKGYLDDRKFGEWFMELQKRRGKSDRAIRAEMFKKGLGRELVDELLNSGPADESARLKQMIEKKQKIPRYRDDPQRLKQYLVRQGFDYDLIKSILN